MKTIEQVLEGVTAGGKWNAGSSGYDCRVPDGEILLDEQAQFGRKTDAAYAARACSNFPALARALKEAIDAIENCDRHVGLLAGDRNKLGIARAALAEALKD